MTTRNYNKNAADWWKNPHYKNFINMEISVYYKKAYNM